MLNKAASNALKPAVGYLRRSTDRQEQSLGDQKAAIERYARDHGYDVLRFYTDDAISGTSTEAPKAFQKLLQDAQADTCDFRAVLVYDIKRFGRVDNDEAGHYRYLLRKNRIDVVYVSEGFQGDDTDDLLRPVKQWQARQESRDLSKVSIRGLLSLSEGGWWMGGLAPYGYDLLYHDGTGKPYQKVRFLPTGEKEVFSVDGALVRTVPRGEHLSTAKSDRAKLVPSAPGRVETVQKIFAMYGATSEWAYGLSPGASTRRRSPRPAAPTREPTAISPGACPRSAESSTTRRTWATSPGTGAHKASSTASPTARPRNARRCTGRSRRTANRTGSSCATPTRPSCPATYSPAPRRAGTTRRRRTKTSAAAGGRIRRSS